MNGFDWKSFLYVSTWDKAENIGARISAYCEAGTMAAFIILAALLPFAELTASREIALWGGFGCWVIRMAALREFRLVRTPLDLPLLLLLLAEITTLFTTPNQAEAIKHLTGETLYWIVLYYLAVNNLRTEKRAMAVIAALLAGALVMDVYGVADYLVRGGSLVEPLFRSYSFHAGSPQFGMYIVQVMPFVLVSVVYMNSSRWKWGLALFSVLHFFSLYLTFSRMDLVSAVFQLAIVLHLAGVSIKKTFFAAIVLIAAAAPFLPMPILVFNSESPNVLKFGPVGIPGIYGSRYYIWSVALEYVRHHPFSGIGGGRHLFRMCFPDLLIMNSAFWHAHNFLISMVVGLGVQGLAAFLFLYYRIIRYLRPKPGDTGEERLRTGSGYMISAAWIMAIGFFMSNMTTDIFEDDAALLFWLLIGCAFSMRHFSSAGKSDQS